jgi:hypothetical protein
MRTVVWKQNARKKRIIVTCLADPYATTIFIPKQTTKIGGRAFFNKPPVMLNVTPARRVREHATTCGRLPDPIDNGDERRRGGGDEVAAEAPSSV